MRRFITRAVVVTTVAVASVGLVATSASAGDGPGSLSVLYGEGTKSHVKIVAQVVGSTGQRVAVTGAEAIALAPSASTDGSVVAYIDYRKAAEGAKQEYVVAIRKDGRIVKRMSMNAQFLGFPVVVADGSAVVFRGALGPRVYDMRTGRISPACAQCPDARSAFSASLSPDGSMIAMIIGRPKGGLDVVVRRTADGRRIVTIHHVAWGLPPAWNPDGSAIAYLGSSNGNDPAAEPAIRTFTIAGRVDTLSQFIGIRDSEHLMMFMSPGWINGTVQAVRVRLNSAVDRLRAEVVTAKDWTSPYRVVGAPLYAGRGSWRDEIVGLVAWTSGLPASAR